MMRWFCPRFAGGFGGAGLIGTFLGLLLVIGLLVLLVLLIVFLWGRISHASAKGSGSTQTAREILQVRYARGELSHEEFKRMTDELKDAS